MSNPEEVTSDPSMNSTQKDVEETQNISIDDPYYEEPWYDQYMSVDDAKKIKATVVKPGTKTRKCSVMMEGFLHTRAEPCDPSGVKMRADDPYYEDPTYDMYFDSADAKVLEKKVNPKVKDENKKPTKSPTGKQKEKKK